VKKGEYILDFLELYYKKYTDTVKASDYVEWACHHLHMDLLEIKKLASMEINESLNLFEIEEMFEQARFALQWKAPSKEQCIQYYIKKLHAQLLVPTENAIFIVKEIYRCTITHDLSEEQLKWQELSDVIDDFQYGDNQNGYSEKQIDRMIISNARKLWWEVG
jgi:hypothetical protein